MANDGNPQYRYETKKVLRGREASTISKMRAEGWELDRQKPGRVQTELNFRKVKKPVPWRLIIPGIVAAVVAAVVIGVFAALGGDDSPNEAAATDSTTPSDTNASADSASEPSSESTSATSSETTATTPSAPTTAPSETSSAAPTPSRTLAPDAVLTVDNSPDLKRLLASGADPAISKDFANRFGGRTIEFNGAVYDTQPYEDYDTRFNFLILGRDFDPNAGGDGPSFQFRDVNFGDLNVEGRGSSVGTGDNLRIVAEVVKFEQSSELFLLDPISTRLR